VFSDPLAFGFELGDSFLKSGDRGASTPKGGFEIRARRFLARPSVGTSLTLRDGSALGIEFVEGELAVFASTDGAEVSLLATLLGLGGSTGIEPHEF
jgi:hypothetical protein